MVITNHGLTPLLAQKAPQTPAPPLGAIFLNPNTNILIEAVWFAHRPMVSTLVSASGTLLLLHLCKSYSHAGLAQILHHTKIPRRSVSLMLNLTSQVSVGQDSPAILKGHDSPNKLHYSHSVEAKATGPPLSHLLSSSVRTVFGLPSRLLFLLEFVVRKPAHAHSPVLLLALTESWPLPLLLP